MVRTGARSRRGHVRLVGRTKALSERSGYGAASLDVVSAISQQRLALKHAEPVVTLHRIDRERTIDIQAATGEKNVSVAREHLPIGADQFDQIETNCPTAGHVIRRRSLPNHASAPARVRIARNGPWVSTSWYPMPGRQPFDGSAKVGRGASTNPAYERRQNRAVERTDLKIKG